MCVLVNRDDVVVVAAHAKNVIFFALTHCGDLDYRNQ